MPFQGLLAAVSPAVALSLAAAALLGCRASGVVGASAQAQPAPAGAAAQGVPSLQGAWGVVEVAARAPGEPWVPRPGPQAGLYVFAARHYSYFYVPGVQPRGRFADPNRPTETEKAAAYDTFIAGAGTYTFDGRTLAMNADLRKNPNEMTGEVWRLLAEPRGDTLRLVFVNPPFLPGREWRTTLVRIE